MGLSSQRLALALGEADWRELHTALQGYRRRVARHFHRLVLGAPEGGSSALRIDLGRAWDDPAETAALVEALAEAGFAAAGEVAEQLLALRASTLVRKLDEAGRRRLQRLLPPLLVDVATVPSAGTEQLTALRRILAILEAMGKRSAYFSLLTESPPVRLRLVRICAQGEFLARQIAAHPLLLDEFIDERAFEVLPGRVELEHELAAGLEGVDADERARRIEAGEDVVVGVNRFDTTEQSPLSGEGIIETVKPEVEQEAIDAIENWRSKRNESEVDKALEVLRQRQSA